MCLTTPLILIGSAHVIFYRGINFRGWIFRDYLVNYEHNENYPTIYVSMYAQLVCTDLFHVMSQAFHVHTNNLVILVYSCHIGTHRASVNSKPFYPSLGADGLHSQVHSQSLVYLVL